MEHKWPVLVMKPFGHVWCWDEEERRFEINQAQEQISNALYCLAALMIVAILAVGIVLHP